MAAVVRSRFYPLMAFALAAIVIVGFAKTYYLRVLFHAPPLTLLLHLHGLVFTAWLGLFAAQVLLISRHNFRLHRKLGIAGAVLAVAVVVIGIFTALVGSHTLRPWPMGFTGQQFLIFPLSAITLFALCVGAGLALRRQAELHKRLMLLGMIAILGPPVARLLMLFGLRPHFMFAQTAIAAIFVTWALLHDWKRRHTLHPVLAIGGPLLVMSWPLRAVIANSEWWIGVARWMTS